MFRRPLVIMIVMAAGLSVLAAGCGSSSNTPSTPSNASAGSTTGGAATTTASASTSASAGSGSAASPAVAQAVAACKASINSAPTLSASVKTKLTGLCDKAAHGDAAGVKKVAAEVCKDIVNASVPSSAPSSIKDQALAACKKA